ncbi:MAG: fructosamine kinase family protein [Weeksellaceae bacterium]|nr:fructosamine kinase family protein [Weeksellaceae bacterium]
MNQNVKNHIEQQQDCKILASLPLGGGDISEVYKLQTTIGDLCVKINQLSNLPMLQAEKTALQELGKIAEITVPKPILCEAVHEHSFLLMTFVEKHASQIFTSEHGAQLAALHTQENSRFGWESDNFIANLAQHNPWTDTWSEFYAVSRIEPQLKIALDHGRLNASQIPSIDIIAQRAANIFSDTRPKLTHGDLWSGNYFVAHDGRLCILDPAVSYSHPAIDIGMMKLFGNISKQMKLGYEDNINEKFPDQDAVALSQLYFLLVHLNLFGESYKSSCIGIMKRYFLG